MHPLLSSPGPSHEGTRAAPDAAHRESGAHRRHARRTGVRLLALAILLLGSVGCVYLRLLEVKNQLRDFDDHFRVEVTDQFVLHFRHPVLLSDDFVYLTQLHPTRTESLSPETRWFVDFHKLDAQGRLESPRKTLTFTMTFDSESKLTRFAFSPLFLAMAPAGFLEASIRSMGKGTVDTDRRQLRVDPQDLPKLKAKLPTARIITDIFGQPAAQTILKEGLLYTYHFIADARPAEQESQPQRLAEVKLLFDPATKELTKMAGKFVGLKLKINYRNLQTPN